LKRNPLPKLKLLAVNAALAAGRRPEKFDRVNFLVSPDEKREIQETAKAFGLTTTKYLLQLHRVARAMLDSRKRASAAPKRKA
jgi:hypothetical protein